MKINMAKTKKIDPKFSLVLIGYILFALLVIAVLSSTTLPFGRMLLDPRTIHVNVANAMIALTVGAFLPALLGYVIGSRSVKSKSKLTRRFNGVLFGLLAYWVTTIFTLFVSIPSGSTAGSHNMHLILANILPSVAIAIVTAALAIAHVRSRQAKQDILEYNPYRILLIGSVILLPVWSLVDNIFAQNVNVYSFVPLLIVGVIGAIAYITLRNSALNKLSRVTWSAVSVSIAFVTVFVSSQLVSGLSNYLVSRLTMEIQAFTSNAAWILALIGWIVYWAIQVKSLSRKG
jgi:hypothetical protein